MPYSIVIKEEAVNDALNTYLYYEDKQPGLGQRFLDALAIRYKQIVENPQHYSYISADKEKTLRDVKVEDFPYLVVFDFDESNVIVYSVLNTHKKSKYF